MLEPGEPPGREAGGGEGQAPDDQGEEGRGEWAPATTAAAAQGVATPNPTVAPGGDGCEGEPAAAATGVVLPGPQLDAAAAQGDSMQEDSVPQTELCADNASGGGEGDVSSVPASGAQLAAGVRSNSELLLQQEEEWEDAEVQGGPATGERGAPSASGSGSGDYAVPPETLGEGEEESGQGALDGEVLALCVALEAGERILRWFSCSVRALARPPARSHAPSRARFCAAGEDPAALPLILLGPELSARTKVAELLLELLRAGLQAGSTPGNLVSVLRENGLLRSIEEAAARRVARRDPPASPAADDATPMFNVLCVTITKTLLLRGCVTVPGGHALARP